MRVDVQVGVSPCFQQADAPAHGLCCGLQRGSKGRKRGGGENMGEIGDEGGDMLF